MVRDSLPRILCTSAGAVTGNETQAVLVIVVGGHELATGEDGCYAVACGLVETSAETPRGPQSAKLCRNL